MNSQEKKEINFYFYFYLGFLLFFQKSKNYSFFAKQNFHRFASVDFLARVAAFNSALAQSIARTTKGNKVTF